MANPFDLLLPCPRSHPAAITMSWSSTARNQTMITSASTLVWGLGWYLLCTALLLSIPLPGPHLRLFPLRAVPFLCPLLPHLPDLIWRQSRCYAEIEDAWERYLNPELMTTAPFSVPSVEPARLKPDENRRHHRIGDTLRDETEIVLSAYAHNNLPCTGRHIHTDCFAICFLLKHP